MRTLGAIAIVVFAFVFVLFHRIAKPVLGAFDVVGNGRQISKFERCAVLFDEFHQVDFVELEIVFVERKFLLRKIISLVDQVKIFGVHLGVFLKLEVGLVTQFQFSNPNVGINDRQFFLIKCRRPEYSCRFCRQKRHKQSKEGFAVCPLCGHGVVAVLGSVHQGKCKK
jgi:hypothetical protein